MISDSRSGQMYDVAIIGGGPAGTTAGTLLRKYNPNLRVVILEKERFPRDHIGESQLPSISNILDEMGVWEKVEAAGFPIKIGGSYTWGRNADRWEFNFFPPEMWKDEPRPGKFEGQRRFTAFQIDRSIFDTILLRHAESCGVEVREECAVTDVLHSGDRVDGLKLSTGDVVSARYYIDASGVVGILRRALGVKVVVTNELRNIAIWNYWQNADWAVRIGVGATRIQIRSLPYGWTWFIPLGPTRTSLGVVIPAEYFKAQGLTLDQFYMRAVNEQKDIASLLTNATREPKLYSTKDWSQLSERIVGENWFLVGEVAGFADPILSAGMSLAHSSARDAAYTILELDRAELDQAWLRERFNDRNRTNVQQHIRFAQYWYSANGCFTELTEHCKRIADEAGLSMTPLGAWRWLSQGGFASELLGAPSIGSFFVSATKQIINLFSDEQKPVGYLADGYNEFALNLKGATKGNMGKLANGRITAINCWQRGQRRLPYTGYYGMVIHALEQTSDAHEFVKLLHQEMRRQLPNASATDISMRVSFCLQALDTMIEDAWVLRRKNHKRPMLRVSDEGNRLIRSTAEERSILERGSLTPIDERI